MKSLESKDLILFVLKTSLRADLPFFKGC
jgi:hypothetical protein